MLVATRQARGSEHLDTLKALGALASVLTEKGDLSETNRYLEELVEVSGKIFGERAPETLEAFNQLAAAKRNLASVQQTQLTLDEAQVELKNTRVLAEENPGDLQLQRDYSRALRRLANIQRQHGKLSDALQSFLQARNIARRLADANPHNTELDDEFIDAAQAVGDIRSTMGSYTEALGDYLEAFSKVTSSNPSFGEPGKSAPERERLHLELQERIENTRLLTIAGGRM